MSVIPKIPRALGGPLGPLPGFYPGPAGDLKRSPDPSPTHAPLTINPGSALVYRFFIDTIAGADPGGGGGGGRTRRGTPSNWEKV